MVLKFFRDQNNLSFVLLTMTYIQYMFNLECPLHFWNKPILFMNELSNARCPVVYQPHTVNAERESTVGTTACSVQMHKIGFIPDENDDDNDNDGRYDYLFHLVLTERFHTSVE